MIMSFAVVLLAQGAYCSDLAKARLASLNIQPAGVVKYLIIYDSRSTSTVLTDQAIHNEPEKMQLDGTKQDNDSALAQALKTIRLGTPDTDLGKKKHSHVDPYVSVGVLHVKKTGGSSKSNEKGRVLSWLQSCTIVDQSVCFRLCTFHFMVSFFVSALALPPVIVSVHFLVAHNTSLHHLQNEQMTTDSYFAIDSCTYTYSCSF